MVRPHPRNAGHRRHPHPSITRPHRRLHRLQHLPRRTQSNHPILRHHRGQPMRVEQLLRTPLRWPRQGSTRRCPIRLTHHMHHLRPAITNLDQSERLLRPPRPDQRPKRHTRQYQQDRQQRKHNLHNLPPTGAVATSAARTTITTPPPSPNPQTTPPPDPSDPAAAVPAPCTAPASSLDPPNTQLPKSPPGRNP